MTTADGPGLPRDAPRRAPLSIVLLAAGLVAVGAVSASAGVTSSLRGTTGLIGVRSAELQVTGVLSVSVGVHYYESADLADSLGCDPGRYASLHLAASYGVSTWLEAGLDIPFRRASWACAETGDLSVQAIDNPSLMLKIALPPFEGPLRLSVFGRFGLPVEDELTVTPGGDEQDQIYLSGGTRPDGEALLLATGDLTEYFPLRIHLNAGWGFNREDDRGRSFYPSHYPPIDGGSTTDNDAVILRGAVVFPGRSIDLFTELRADMIRDRDLVAPKENALAVTPGVRVRFGGGLSATVGFSVGISGNDRSTEEFDPQERFPDWELSAAIAYAWPALAADSDDDGIPDFRDGCPRKAEDVDHYQDDDGCPDPDNDGDMIPDEMDGDPDLPEDFDGFEDGDGVPDLDNDSDGIVDQRDMCPDEAEDLDGFEDEDGCPDR